MIVPPGFCQHRSSSDRIIQTIPLDNTLMRDVPVFFKSVPVNDQVLHLTFKLFHRTMHRQKRSIQNINSVNFFMTYKAKSQPNRMLLDKFPQPITRIFRDRKRYVTGTRMSVRVVLGRSRYKKKKKKK